MLPIEPVFEDIRRTLRIGDPTSVGVFTSDTTQIHTQVPKIRIQAPGDPIALKSDIDVGSSHGKNANPNPESKPSGSKPQHESVNRSYQESRSKSGNIVLDNDTYDPSLPTCLSSEGHESNIRDPVQHYFGCLRENDKEPFFQSLSETLKRAVEVEKERIIRRRSLFENLDGTEQLVGMFRTSLVEFVYPRRDRLRPNMISPLVPAAEGGKMSLLNLDIRSDVVYFKDSNPYTDLSPRFEGEFPNQTISLADLLTSDEASPLTWDCGSNMVRYFHLPANNMSWVEVRTPTIGMQNALSKLTINRRKQYLIIMTPKKKIADGKNDNQEILPSQI